MQIGQIIKLLETLAPPAYQESYDNAGLITGDAGWNCTGILVSLDVTEVVVQNAIANGCNLIVAHHPIVFGGLKKINGKNYVEQTVIAAIKNDVAIYAIHTNLDNVLHGVNGKIAELLGLKNVCILDPKPATLKKLYTYVPVQQAEQVRNAIFEVGGGQIGNYSECSFEAEGHGTFKAGENTNPFVGMQGQRHTEKEVKLEIIFPAYLETTIIAALKAAHPYEEVAFETILLSNTNQNIGSGMVGNLENELTETDFLQQIGKVFNVPAIKHTALLGRKIKRVAVCGGAGSFLIGKAIAAKVDIFITADMKYHEFFDANGKIIIADVGHFESEQYTIDLLYGFLQEKFPTFAVLKSTVNTNPVHYFLG